MQRVNLGEPFEKYIQELVASGYYASASEVLRDALRFKMEHNEKWKAKQLKMLIQEGLDDIEAGRVVPFSKDLLEKAFTAAKYNALKGIEIPDHIKP